MKLLARAGPESRRRDLCPMRPPVESPFAGGCRAAVGVPPRLPRHGPPDRLRRLGVLFSGWRPRVESFRSGPLIGFASRGPRPETWAAAPLASLRASLPSLDARLTVHLLLRPLRSLQCVRTEPPAGETRGAECGCGVAVGLGGGQGCGPLTRARPAPAESAVARLTVAGLIVAGVSSRGLGGLHVFVVGCASGGTTSPCTDHEVTPRFKDGPARAPEGVPPKAGSA